MNHFDEAREREKRGKSGAPALISPQAKDFLNLVRPPARLNVEQTAARLGFKAHDIPILVAQKFLKPLGNPAPNCEKYFMRETILDFENDEKWLSDATEAVTEYWRNKNARRAKADNSQ